MGVTDMFLQQPEMRLKFQKIVITAQQVLKDIRVIYNTQEILFPPERDRLVACLVVRRPPRERKILGSNPACAGIFFRVESYR